MKNIRLFIDLREGTCPSNDHDNLCNLTEKELVPLIIVIIITDHDIFATWLAMSHPSVDLGAVEEGGGEVLLLTIADCRWPGNAGNAGDDGDYSDTGDTGDDGDAVDDGDEDDAGDAGDDGGDGDDGDAGDDQWQRHEVLFLWVFYHQWLY